MPRLVSRAEFARLCKVSKAAITKACAKALGPACSADRIDVDHPAAVAYRKAKEALSDAAATAPSNSKRRRSRAPTRSRKATGKPRRAPTTPRPKREPGPPAAEP